jgi:hypothetical protein
MNFRVFLLIAVTAAFGAIWSSDGRYQTEQVALARAERARSANVVAQASNGAAGDRSMFETDKRFAAMKLAGWARSATTAAVNLLAPTSRPLRRKADDGLGTSVVIGRLAVAWVINIDPRDNLKVVMDQGAQAKSRFEERLCLLRFRTREMTFFASRRAVAFLRSWDATPRTDRMVRIRQRKVSVEATQAPPAGGREIR